MIRFTKAFVATAALLVVPSVASAVSITIVNATESGANDGTLQPGETITFDLRMTDNVGGPDIFGLGVEVNGYDSPDVSGTYDNGVAFSSGTVVGSAFDTTLGGAVALGFGSVNTLSGATEVWSVNSINPQAYVTRLFEGVSTTAALGDGTEDLGIAGNPIASDLHFQVTFANVAAGNGPSYSQTANFSFDVNIVTTGGVVNSTSTPYSLTVVPEPGTALLMGLGLVGLASARRR